MAMLRRELLMPEQRPQRPAWQSGGARTERAAAFVLDARPVCSQGAAAEIRYMFPQPFFNLSMHAQKPASRRAMSPLSPPQW